jgi:hypothetical protein
MSITQLADKTACTTGDLQQKPWGNIYYDSNSFNHCLIRLFISY